MVTDSPGSRSIVASRAGLGVASVLVLLVTACTGPLGGPTSCVDWASFPDDESRTAASEVVVVGQVHGPSGERSMFGTRAAVWDVEVIEVVKGEVRAGDHLDVASTPHTCTTSLYPDGDPLDTDEPVRLYLSDTDFAVDGTERGLALITPMDGVQPAE